MTHYTGFTEQLNMVCKSITVSFTYSVHEKALLPITSWTMMPLSPPTDYMTALH